MSVRLFDNKNWPMSTREFCSYCKTPYRKVRRGVREFGQIIAVFFIYIELMVEILEIGTGMDFKGKACSFVRSWLEKRGPGKAARCVQR